ncbi:MAG: glycosyltransferase family 4 protein [Terriglobia bacterium]
MNILYPVITNYSGADVYFQRLVASLAARGVQTQLHSYPHLLEFLPYRALKPFFGPAQNCDLVHSKAEYGWLFATPGVPLVVTLAHSVFDPAYDRYQNPLQRCYHHWKVRANIVRSFATAARVVTVSRFSQQAIQQTYGHPDVRVIYNAVDETFFHPRPDEPPRADKHVRLLFVGNLTPRKGADLLPRILERLGNEFVLEYTCGLRTRATPAPHPRMRPLGRLSSQALREAYQRCDIFLFPSRLEGFGYPVAEAMACGKPVVTTNYAALPELLDDERGGFLCPMDDVDSFAAKIRLLAADPGLRARMGAYNRAKVEQHFSLAPWAANYLQLYRELL